VATAAATLPSSGRGCAAFATAIWVLPPLAPGAHRGRNRAWARQPRGRAGSRQEPGQWCSSTARRRGLLTVGAGPCSRHRLIGAHAALLIDAVPLGRWATLAGLGQQPGRPYLMFTRLRAAPDAAFGGWLIARVPPMVSAATGALLIPHLPPASPGWRCAGLLRDVRDQP